MRSPSTLLFLTFSLAGLQGCETSDLGSVDPKPVAPFLSALVVLPDTIHIDSLSPPPVGGLYSIRLSATASIHMPNTEGSDLTVTGSVLSPNSPGVAAEFRLRDDGNLPDSIAGDGVFAGVCEFFITRAEAGMYQIRCVASTSTGYSSNLKFEPIVVTRNNAPPELFSQSLVAPDTVTRPVTGRVLVFFSVAAADSDGLGDILEVYFRNLSSTNPTAKIFLLDDGGVINPVTGVGSGDVLAGDGTFSRTLQVEPTNTPGLNILQFQAADRAGDTSASFIHNFYIR